MRGNSLGAKLQHEIQQEHGAELKYFKESIKMVKEKMKNEKKKQKKNSILSFMATSFVLYVF